ncbi:MAG: protein kinase [Oscillatoriales cyanobacterium RM2_1_1]|nr:protein kinase [Oscillatoriales cyanobacterium SM2_3_0]NJO44713.1 protein kinase [Oscillatoriales cyanobacterium RM2_1_1]
MSYCLNPQCLAPHNSEEAASCQRCGFALQLHGQYTAIQPLGKGGMGRTFRAVDAHQGATLCVIKQFSAHLQTQSTLAKAAQLFTQEAIRLQELGSHDQIPALVDSFEQDGFWYLVQQFIDGQDLLQEIEQSGAFDDAKIIQLLTDLLPVLSFIHGHQVIHRDIKPENIIRRKSDQKLILVDFGVAKYSQEMEHPKTGTLTGTIGYAPLEQIRGGKAYPASDLYSLGMTCVHLLTQVSPNELFDPFSGELIWRSHLQQNHHTISHHLGQILDKLLQDVVKDRYQTATAVLQDLQYPFTSRIEPLNLNLSSISPLQVITSIQLEIFKQHQASPLSYKFLIKNGKDYLTSAPSTCLLASEIQAQTPLSPQFHPLAFSQTPQITLLQPPVQSPVPWTLIKCLKGHMASVETMAIGPGGYLLASGSRDQTIHLWNLKTGQLLHRFLGHHNTVKSVTISPDGRRLVSGSLDRTILAWNLNFRRMADQFFSHSGSPYSHRCGAIYAVAYSPDGKLVASGSADHSIKLWNQRNGELLCRLREHLDIVLSIAFVPFSREEQPGKLDVDSPPFTSLFASGGADGLIKIWKFGDFNSLQTLRGHQDAVYSLAFSPNQEILVSGSGDRTIKLWHVQTGELLQTLTGHPEMVRSVAISADGQLLASGGPDGTVRLWNLDQWNRDQKQSLASPLATLSGCDPVMFTPDQQALVTGDLNNNILVWQSNR